MVDYNVYLVTWAIVVLYTTWCMEMLSIYEYFNAIAFFSCGFATYASRGDTYRPANGFLHYIQGGCVYGCKGVVSIFAARYLFQTCLNFETTRLKVQQDACLQQYEPFNYNPFTMDEERATHLHNGPMLLQEHGYFPMPPFGCVYGLFALVVVINVMPRGWFVAGRVV